jgi:uncharacterized protein
MALAIIGALFLAGNTNRVELRTAAQVYKLEVASQPHQLSRGLGGRQGLARGQGMLFRFPAEGKHCFWMQDMRFPIDIIWLNNSKRVVTIAGSVSPTTYPKEICPDKPARYVIELNAGEVQWSKIREGQALSF